METRSERKESLIHSSKEVSVPAYMKVRFALSETKLVDLRDDGIHIYDTDSKKTLLIPLQQTNRAITVIPGHVVALRDNLLKIFDGDTGNLKHWIRLPVQYEEEESLQARKNMTTVESVQSAMNGEYIIARVKKIKFDNTNTYLFILNAEGVLLNTILIEGNMRLYSKDAVMLSPRLIVFLMSTEELWFYHLDEAENKFIKKEIANIRHRYIVFEKLYAGWEKPYLLGVGEERDHYGHSNAIALWELTTYHNKIFLKEIYNQQDIHSSDTCAVLPNSFLYSSLGEFNLDTLAFDEHMEFQRFLCVTPDYKVIAPNESGKVTKPDDDFNEDEYNSVNSYEFKSVIKYNETHPTLSPSEIKALPDVIDGAFEYKFPAVLQQEVIQYHYSKRQFCCLFKPTITDEEADPAKPAKKVH